LISYSSLSGRSLNFILTGYKTESAEARAKERREAAAKKKAGQHAA
jgi:hypothetical protein